MIQLLGSYMVLRKFMHFCCKSHCKLVINNINLNGMRSAIDIFLAHVVLLPSNESVLNHGLHLLEY